MDIYDQLVINSPHNTGLLFSISAFDNDKTFQTFNSFGYFTMILVTKGNGIVYADLAEYKFHPGCLICFSLFQRFRIMSERMEGVIIHFHPEFYCLHKHRHEVSCNGVLFNNIYATPVLALPVTEMQHLQILADGFQSEMLKADIEQEVLLSYLKIFLIDASRLKLAQQQEGQAPVHAAESLVASRLREAIDRHYKTWHSASDYAKLLQLSTKSLNRISKTYFHKTLSDLITDRLIVEAKRELYLTSKQIKLIAYELGFDDEFYFSRFFKTRVSVSPKLFRDTAGFNKGGDDAS